MKVALNDKDGAIEIVVEGTADLNATPALRKAFLDAGKSKAPEIQVLLAAVDYMDSSGLATLMEGLHVARQAGKSFVLKSPSESVLKLLQLTHLDSVFDVSLDTA